MALETMVLIAIERTGKKQVEIEIEMLCDDEGLPVSVEVFRGITSHMKVFESQIRKAAG